MKVVFLDSKLLEEVIRVNNQIDYYEVAMTLLYTGTSNQRRIINSIMKNCSGYQRTDELKEYIDMEIMLGNIEV